MSEPPVIHALVRKRAELAGEVAELERQARAVRLSIKNVDACLALFGYRHHPKGIKPIQPRRETMFQFGQLKRMVLDIRRQAGRPMVNQDIAREIIKCMGWTETEALLTTITAKVKDVTKKLPAGTLSV